MAFGPRALSSPEYSLLLNINVVLEVRGEIKRERKLPRSP